MITLFSVSGGYLPSRSTWLDWNHAKKCVLSSGLTVDGWIIHKQQRMLGEKQNKIWSVFGFILQLCRLPMLTVFISFYMLHIFQRGLYPSRLVRTSCAICFITVSIINLRQFELLTFESILNVLHIQFLYTLILFSELVELNDDF